MRTVRCAARLSAAAALCAFATSAHAHGGLSMDEDTCKLRVGNYLMHFVGYQPDSPSGPKEFCEDIPETGRTVVVLDYLHDELRDRTTEVRVVRDQGTGSEPPDGPELEAITVLHIPARHYPSGSLHFEHRFDEPGQYVGLVTVDEGVKLVSRFPFSVGRKPSYWHWVVLGAVAAALVFVLYQLGVRRRTQAGRPHA